MTKHFKIKAVIFMTLYIAASSSLEAAPPKPNIIFIYADDLGKGMLSAYGQQHFTTPNIDALAAGGVDFTRAYGSSETTLARASLMTGYYDCSQSKWRIANGGVYIREDTSYIDQGENFINSSQILLPPNDPYLPQVFGKAGYVTAQIGLLGWGNASTRLQMEQHGWNYFYGYLDHVRSRGYYPPFLFENSQIVKIEGNTRTDGGKAFDFENEKAYQERWNMEGKKVYSPDLFINKTIEFIREFKDKPFFLMFSSPLPHGPVSIPQIDAAIAADNSLTPIEKEYASMVKLLDDHTGRLMACLRELGLEEKTIIVFSSDNGHEISYPQEGRIDKRQNRKTNERFDNSYHKYYSDRAGDVFNGNAGLAGLKRSNLEGGVRVPLIVYWKGVLTERTCDEVVSGYDFLPTMADLLNVKTPPKSGMSYLPTLMNGRKLSEKRYVVVSSDEGPALIANNGWKLRYCSQTKKYELYNLKTDPEEKYNVILRFPKEAEKWKKLLQKDCNSGIVEK